MKVVQFRDGSFGVRKGNWLIGYKYHDFVRPQYWWPVGTYSAAYRTDEVSARNYVDNNHDIGIVVEDK